MSIIALLPIIAAASTNVNSFMGLGGTALLIIVGVSLDLLKQIDSFILKKNMKEWLRREFICFFGPAGSGKGTQAQYLKKSLGFSIYLQEICYVLR